MPGMTDRRIYLREWRKHRGYTQDEVAARLAEFDDPLIPKTGATLSRIETRKLPYSERILEALADIYQCEPHELLGRDPSAEGDVIDLVRILDERQRKQAMAIISALADSEKSAG